MSHAGSSQRVVGGCDVIEDRDGRKFVLSWQGRDMCTEL